MKYDKTTEEIFINNFVIKAKRERCLFELTSKEKRSHFFNKLCHHYDQIFDSRFMRLIPTPNSCANDLYNMLIKEGAENQCYIMSNYSDLDGSTMALNQALEACVGRGLPSILFCLKETVAYFEAEQHMGPPPRFILKKKA